MTQADAPPPPDPVDQDEAEAEVEAARRSPHDVDVANDYHPRRPGPYERAFEDPA